MSDPREILERVLTGELAADAPEIRALRERDAAFARELDELLQLQGLLGADAADEREALGDTAGSPGDDVVVSTVRRLAGGGKAPRRDGPRLLVVLVAAAAVIAAILIVPRLGQEADDGIQRDDRILGPGEEIVLHMLTPDGPDQTFTSFAFEATLAEGAQIEIAYGEIRIWPADAEAGAEPFLKTTFSGFAWSPSDAQLESLPDAIRWEVRVFDVEGRPLARASVDLASR